MKNRHLIITSIITLFVILLCNNTIIAQSNFRYEAELITPSTDSWNMIKYGTVGASLYTGTINVSIPFYTYKDKDFTIPISFDYASNGHMPNQKAGILGPDWNLNVGGTITADIKGTPDYSSDSYGNPGFFPLSKNSAVMGRDLSKIFRFVNLDYRITTGMHSPVMLFCPDGYPHTPGTKYDSEPDLYNFSFFGHSGSFHRGYGDTTYVYGTNSNNRDYRIIFASDFSLISIIPSDGYKYEFSTTIGNSDLVEEADRNLRVAWKLTRIVAPNGRTVTFNYTSYSNSCCQPASIDIEGYLIQHGIGGQNMEEIGVQWEHNITEMIKSNLILSSIVISNGPTITFNYNHLNSSQSDEFAPIQNLGLPTIVESHRLTGITVSSLSNPIIKDCSLTYMNNNTGKRINYLESVNISGEGLFQMDYYNWQDNSHPFPGNGTLSVDHWGYYNGKNNDNNNGIPFLKLGYISGGSLVITSTARDADASYAKTGMLKKLSYPTGGYSMFDYEAHDYSLAFKRQYSNMLVSEVGICGGLRLKSVLNYNSTSELSSSRTFEYKSGTSSSGILLHFPVYYAEYSAYATSGISENYIRYYSSGINSYTSTHIEYSRVIEIHNDNSSVVYDFSNSALSTDYEDGVLVDEVVNEPFYVYGIWTINNSFLVDLTAPLSSKQADRGKLVSKQIFNADHPSYPEYSETYSYNTGTNLSMDYLPAYFIRKIGYYSKYIDNYKQTGHIVSENRNGTIVTRGEKYNHNSHGQVIRIATCDSKGDSLITKLQYVWDLDPSLVTPTSVFNSMISNNVINQPISEMVYVKKGGIGSEILVSGKRYTYVNPVSSNKAIIRLSKIEQYDNSTYTWYTDIEFTSFDSNGNILESKDRNGIYTSYVWGHNGLYMVAKVDNLPLNTLKIAVPGLSGISSAPLTGGIVSGVQSYLRSSYPNSQATLYEYIPFVGLSKVTDPSGKQTNYEYNSSGKLKSVKDSRNQPQNTFFYSPDNKL